MYITTRVLSYNKYNSLRFNLSPLYPPVQTAPRYAMENLQTELSVTKLKNSELMDQLNRRTELRMEYQCVHRC